MPMLRASLSALLAIFTFSLVACSSEPSPDTEPAPADEYDEVLAHTWTIQPGEETYYCAYQTLTEDLWVSTFRPISPDGTHHVTLGFSEPGPPDGIVPSSDTTASPPCTGITLGDNLVYFSGIGTDAMQLPEGVAVRLPAGKQLVLSVHVYNASDLPLTGRSGIEVLRPDPSDVVHEAEVVAAGAINIRVPPGRSTLTGKCTMPEDVHVFALAPHMHYSGVHMKASAVFADGGRETLLDADYRMEQQPYTRFDPPILIGKDEALEVVCDYENGLGKTLGFGESSDQEMCFSFTYRYPAVGPNFLCVQ